MKKIILVLSIFLLMGASCNKQEQVVVNQEKELPKQIINCGLSEECFSNNVKTCTLAKGEVDDNEGAYIQTVEGYKDDYCIVTLTYTKSSLPAFINKKMACKVPKVNLADFKDYLQGDNMKNSCEGTLIDLLIQMDI